LRGSADWNVTRRAQVGDDAKEWRFCRSLETSPARACGGAAVPTPSSPVQSSARLRFAFLSNCAAIAAGAITIGDMIEVSSSSSQESFARHSSSVTDVPPRLPAQPDS